MRHPSRLKLPKARKRHMQEFAVTRSTRPGIIAAVGALDRPHVFVPGGLRSNAKLQVHRARANT